MKIPFNYQTVEGWLTDAASSLGIEPFIYDAMNSYIIDIGQAYENLELDFIGDWESQTDFVNHSFIFRNIVIKYYYIFKRYMNGTTGKENVDWDPSNIYEHDTVYTGHRFKIEEEAPITSDAQFPNVAQSPLDSGITSPSFKDSNKDDNTTKKNGTDTTIENKLKNLDLIDRVKPTYFIVIEMLENMVEEYSAVY